MMIVKIALVIDNIIIPIATLRIYELKLSMYILILLYLETESALVFLL